MELLHVSAYRPFLLTQKFGNTSTSAVSSVPASIISQLGQFNQRAPWFDENLAAGAPNSHRLYRFFELVETRNWMAGENAAQFTCTNNIAAGLTTVTPSSMSTITSNGASIKISPGDVLVIEPGTANMENVRVASTTATSFTVGPLVGFLRTHTANSMSPITILHTATGGRALGKINLSTSYAAQPSATTPSTDGEIFRALCDAQAGTNNFTGPTNLTSWTSAGTNWTNATDDVSIAFQQVQKLVRPTPGLISSTDRPFQGMAVGQIQPGGAGSQYPLGAGLADTFCRTYNSTANTTVPIFLASSQAATGKHPILQYELLNKIFNNTTSRSNVYAVWLTVGFFEVVTDPTTKQIQYSTTTGLPALGAELGLSAGNLGANGSLVRHQMFAIVDRSALAVPRLACNLAQAINNTGAQSMVMNSTAGITTGTQLLINPGGADYEAVTVTGFVNGNIQATFTQKHQTIGEPVYIAPGFWGPQPQFDVSQPVHQPIVPYYGIIR